MADVTQSFSQLLRTYGPGAMLDMPEHAVVVAGLQGWRYGARWKSIAEERLVPLLRDQLGLGSEFEGLRAPPEFDEERRDPDAPGVDGLQPRRADNEVCDKDLRLLPRSATNTYFAQTVTVISLTRTDDRVRQKLDEHRATVDSIRALPNFLDILRSLPQTRDVFAEFSDEDIRRALDASAGTEAPVAQNPKIAEFDLLASGGATIGTDEPGSFLFAETLDRKALDLSAPWSEFLRGVVKVGRLREVTCLYGFTRLEPPPSAAETDLEEIQLVVDGAALVREVRWLPALEQFGEGIFVHVDPGYMHGWLAPVLRSTRMPRSCGRPKCPRRNASDAPRET